MIYNFVEYLKNEFPAEKFYTNIRATEAGQDFIPDRCFLVNESGGAFKAWTFYTEKTVQVIARDLDAPTSREMAWDIFEKLKTRIGLILPSVTVKGVVYPAIQVSQISAIQEPYNLGADENGRVKFTTNYHIIFKR